MSYNQLILLQVSLNLWIEKMQQKTFLNTVILKQNAKNSRAETQKNLSDFLPDPFLQKNGSNPLKRRERNMKDPIR